jgi:hypothetical protein
MDNVVGFDAFDSEQQIGAHQAGLPRVVLEGQTDVNLFRDWFRNLRDVVDFVEAGEVVPGSGCTSVPAAVAHSQEQDNLPAIGIVDRDTLFRQRVWELLYTRDDATFAAAQNEDVVIASLWELEAYLLRPDLFADWIKTRRGPLPAPPEMCTSAVATALEEAEALLDIAPILAALHVAQEACPNGWGLHLPAANLAAECAQAFAHVLEQQKAVADEVRDLVAEIRAHAPGDDGDRFIFLLKYVDTKRLIDRLARLWTLAGNNPHLALNPLLDRDAYSPAELAGIVTDYADKWAA